MILLDPHEPDFATRLNDALRTIRADVLTQRIGTVNDDFQCSIESTGGKLRGHPIRVSHSCKRGQASAFWMVVYVGKGRSFHIDARRAFHRAEWYGEQLYGSEQRHCFLRDLNDRFQSATEFAVWAVTEDMPRIHQDLADSPVEQPYTLATKGIPA